MSKIDKNKKKKKSSAAIYFLAAAVVTAIMVKAILEEGKKVKAENESLAFDVYW
jgi:hypothetical protein